MLSAMVGNRILANNIYADGNGQLTKQTYGNGAEVSITYDTLGRKKLRPMRTARFLAMCTTAKAGYTA